MYHLQLTWSFEKGSPGTDSDPKNPLSRALNRLFEDGQPFARISLCFSGDLNGGTPRWLGAFILSAGARVIFFPGFNFSSDWVQRVQGKSEKWRRSFNLDHITLEKDLINWHLTTTKSKKHQSAGQTTPLGEDRALWFGMSVATGSMLRELKAKTIVSSRIPPSDGRRRAKVFQQANDNAVYLWAGPHPDAQKHFSTGFFHFAFIVGPHDFPHYQGSQLGLPSESPYLEKPLPDLEQLPVNSQRLSLGDTVDIEIATLWLPGILTVPVAFSGM